MAQAAGRARGVAHDLRRVATTPNPDRAAHDLLRRSQQAAAKEVAAEKVKSDPDGERVGDHLTGDLKFAAPNWSLEDAASVMIRGGFRHLVVVEGAELIGVLSMRDIVRCWTQDGSTSEIPAVAQA